MMMNWNNPYMPQAQPQMQQTHNGINWVQGIESAKAFQLPPNSNTVLMDSEQDNIFYIKVSDNIGMSSLRIFKYEEITNTPAPNNDYITRQEFEDAIKKLGGIKNEQPISTTKSKSKQSVIAD